MLGATERKPVRRTKADTTPGPDDQGLVSARTSGELRIERRKMAFPSSRASTAGLPRTIERMGGGFRAGGKIGARWAGLGVTHGAVPALLPGTRAI